MARVTGIGGVFFKAKDPKALTAWYAEHLGIPVGKWGHQLRVVRRSPGRHRPDRLVDLPADSKHFGPGDQTCMINYRVDDLDALLKQLETAGVWIDPKRDDASYGKFAWIQDPEGNRVELWQPLADEAPAAS